MRDNTKNAMNCISSDGLYRLAKEADRAGAKRYADAYRLLAQRLNLLGVEGKLNTCEPEDLWPPEVGDKR